MAKNSKKNLQKSKEKILSLIKNDGTMSEFSIS